MIEVRFHGRGGQGAKVASRILGRSGFLAGLYAQDFAIFGAERRGAPVVSCTRLDEQPIETRGYVETPSFVVVMDHSLMKEAREQVFHGVDATTPLFINGTAESFDIVTQEPTQANFIFIDLSTICRRVIGRPFVSAAAAAVAAKSIASIPLEALVEAAQIEFTDFGMAQELIMKNEAAAREAYALAPAIVLSSRRVEREQVASVLESIPYLNTAQFISPAIRHRASAALRHTGNWRMERPEIELGKCKRCFLCYLYCPEAAIQLDAENYPHVDYDHCKGCMTCFTECPTEAIARRAED
ncbi:MAG: 2-oxoacid:acceptor oxidoreductase family protein [Deltaproteobacteria bacterium]